MTQALLFIIAVAVTFAGCAVLFVDAIVTKRTDYCQEKTPADYRGVSAGSLSTPGGGSFFVIASPKFRYEFDGRQYEGQSANVFFHLFVGKGGLMVPFLDGKSYYVFVNPAQPDMYVTDGEQRVAFLHVTGCAVAAIGIVLLCFATGVFG